MLFYMPVHKHRGEKKGDKSKTHKGDKDYTSKIGTKSKTRKGEKAYTTKKTSKDHHIGGHDVKEARKPYAKKKKADSKKKKDASKKKRVVTASDVIAYRHSHKGDHHAERHHLAGTPSHTRPGDLDYTTKSGDLDYHRHHNDVHVHDKRPYMQHRDRKGGRGDEGSERHTRPHAAHHHDENPRQLENLRIRRGVSSRTYWGKAGAVEG